MTTDLQELFDRYYELLRITLDTGRPHPSLMMTALKFGAYAEEVEFYGLANCYVPKGGLPPRDILEAALAQAQNDHRGGAFPVATNNRRIAALLDLLS